MINKISFKVNKQANTHSYLVINQGTTWRIFESVEDLQKAYTEATGLKKQTVQGM